MNPQMAFNILENVVKNETRHEADQSCPECVKMDARAFGWMGCKKSLEPDRCAKKCKRMSNKNVNRLPNADDK